MANEDIKLDMLAFGKDKTDVEPRVVPCCSEDASTTEKRPNDSAFSRLSRELSEEDLNASGTKKMILNLVDTLHAENRSLKGVQARYYEIDKQFAILKERYDNLRNIINIKNVISILGSMLFGFIPTLHSRGWNIWSLLVVAMMSLIMVVMPYIVLTSRRK